MLCRLKQPQVMYFYLHVISCLNHCAHSTTPYEANLFHVKGVDLSSITVEA